MKELQRQSFIQVSPTWSHWPVLRHSQNQDVHLSLLRKLQGIKHLDLSLLPSQAIGRKLGLKWTLTSVQVECHYYRDGFSGYDTKCRAACQKLLTTVLRHMWKWDTRLSQEAYSNEDWEHHLWHNEQTSIWVFFSGGRNTRGEHQEVKALK